MIEVLEDLLAEVEGQFELAGVWCSGKVLEGYTIALNEVCGLIREQIEIQKLGE